MSIIGSHAGRCVGCFGPLLLFGPSRENPTRWTEQTRDWRSPKGVWKNAETGLGCVCTIMARLTGDYASLVNQTESENIAQRKSRIFDAGGNR